MERLKDVQEHGQPYKDTLPRYFADQHGITMSTELGPGSSARDFYQFGVDNPPVEMPPLSFSKDFIPASQITNRQVVTTYGHHHQYLRPSMPGPGWGDYERFDHCRSCGRRLPEELIDRDPGKAPGEVDPDPDPAWGIEMSSFWNDEGEKKRLAPRPIWKLLENTKETRASTAAGRGGAMFPSALGSRYLRYTPEYI